MASDSHSIENPGRVVFITRKWAPAVGGMETYSMRLSEELASLCKIDVIALSGNVDGSPPSAWRLLTFPLTALCRYWPLRADISVLHLADMALWPLAILGRLGPRRPVVVLSAHGTDVAYHRRKTIRGKLYGAYLKLGAKLLRKARVIANSQATREVAAETGWRCRAVIPLATDMVGPEPDGTHQGYILFAGRLVERKGCGWFIRHVLPLLPQHITLKVAGTVWNPEEKAALTNPRVTFLGPLPATELAHAYRDALCVIVPNIRIPNGEYEGFGLVAPEAAAAGGLVLASNCDGLRDAVIDTVTGWLLPPGDRDAWARKVNEVVHWDMGKRRTFLQSAVRKAQEHYAWPRVAREVLAVYRPD
ncbi:MAG: glycosyltransferase family 4 protein [Novosphingobium sp.]|nr:glycosyltransferase family 4 protein [Novosphingobium sp.]